MTDPGHKRTLGRYELFESLGRGAATEAFRAKSFGVEGFEKTLVVKRVHPELAALPAFLEPFLEQVQRVMRLSHANLAQTFDLGVVDRRGGTGPGTPQYFFATEFVAGVDLRTLIERSRASGALPPPAIAAYVALEVAKALEHAHRRRDEQGRPLGIVHGAVAPHNVMVGFEGDVKLTDFGVTQALLALPRPWSTLSATYGALAPEQASGAPPSVASDVYSLGLLLHTLLTGELLGRGEQAAVALERARRADVPGLHARRGGVPAPLDDIVARALSLDPQRRHASVSALHEDLLACSYALGLRASPSDVSRFVEAHRDAPASEPSEETIGAALSRPLTMPPLSLAEPVGVTEEPPAPRSSTSIPPLTGFGEKQHVSVLVLSLGNAGSMTDALRARMRSTCERYGGSHVSETPTEAIAYFGLERADGRDTERAVRCGLVLARALDTGDLAPGVGIDSGRVRVDADRAPVDDERAAALIESARSLAVDSPCAVRVSRRAAASLVGRFPLEGADAGFTVREFSQDGFTDPFVGRKAELSHLGETLVLAARGELQVIAITGDPGVGKTRLAVEMQRRLSRGTVDLRTFFATCPPRGRKAPQSGVVAMLRRVCGVRDGDPLERIDALEPRLRALGLDNDEVLAVLGELGAAQTADRVTHWATLRSAVLRMMQSLAEDRFTVFVWDDAHELDDASADLLARAAGRLSHSRLSIVLSGRPDVRAPFRTVPVHADVRLGPMGPQDVERLVATRLGVDEVPPPLLDFVADRADGQPMFVEELIRQLQRAGMLEVGDGQVKSLALDERVPVPRTLQALTGERLRQLTHDQRNLFVAAAVLEPPVDLAVLARLLELPFPLVDRVAESLIERGLLSRDGPSSFGFPSPLSREVVLSELEAADLAVLHRRAAAAYAPPDLEADAQDDANRAGYHLAAAGDRDAAADHYARVGLSHLASRRPVRAALSLAYALDLIGLDGRPSTQTENWVRALGAAIRYVRTGPTLSGLIDRLVRRVDGESSTFRAEVRVDVACILGALDRQLEGESLLVRSEHLALQGGAGPAHFAALAELASDRGEYAQAREALAAFGSATFEDRAAMHRVLLTRARVAGAAGDRAAADAALAEAERLAASDDPLLALDRAVARTALCALGGRHREAAEAAVAAAAQAEELGLVYEVASILCDQAIAFIRLGDAARARAAVASALHAAEEAGAQRIVLRARMVLGALEGEDSGEAGLTAQRERIDVAEDRGWVSDALIGRYLLARTTLRLGNSGEGQKQLAVASKLAEESGNLPLAKDLRALLAKVK